MNAYRRVARTFVIVDMALLAISLVVGIILLVVLAIGKMPVTPAVIVLVSAVVGILISIGTINAIDNDGSIWLWAILNVLFVWIIPGILLGILGWMDRYQRKEPAIRTIERQEVSKKVTPINKPKPLQQPKVETNNEQAKIDAIKQYKQMMDDGIITKQDFEKKKNELLKGDDVVEEETKEVLEKEEPKERVVDDSKAEIKLNDKVVILNDTIVNGKVFKANSAGIVDNTLMSIGGKQYVVILDNDPDKTEINLRRQEIKKIK